VGTGVAATLARLWLVASSAAVPSRLWLLSSLRCFRVLLFFLVWFQGSVMLRLELRYQMERYRWTGSVERPVATYWHVRVAPIWRRVLGGAAGNWVTEY
jgi:hypothetical protein